MVASLRMLFWGPGYLLLHPELSQQALGRLAKRWRSLGDGFGQALNELRKLPQFSELCKDRMIPSPLLSLTDSDIRAPV